MVEYKYTTLHDLPMEDCIKEWDRIEKLALTKPSGIIAAHRVLAKTDLFYLLVRVCGMKFALHPWVYDRVREVEKDPDGYLDLWAREHFKSTIITFGMTIKDILNDPEITIGFFSENYTLAQKLMLQVKRELEENVILKAAFDDILWDNPKSEAPMWSGDGIIVKRKGNPKEPTLECQGLLSLKTGAHYQLMVYDDVITQASVTSPETVDKVTSNFEISLSQSKEGGKKRMIGTRYSHADTYQTAIEREMFEPRIYEATHDGTSEGVPVLFSPEYWETKKRENSTFNLACQYLQNPQSAGEKVFDKEKIQRYEIRPSILNVVILVDPAKSLKKGSCNTAMLVIGIGGNKRYYLLDGFCHRMTLPERWEHLKHLHYKWKTDPGVGLLRVGYETYGSGSVDVEHFENEMKKDNAPRFEITPLTSALNSSSRKKDRIERMQPDVTNGFIFVPAVPPKQGGLTKAQAMAHENGTDWRIAKQIRRKDSNKQIYDLTEVFLRELDLYPYGKLVDTLDCWTRVYDMQIETKIGAPRGSSWSASASSRRSVTSKPEDLA